MKPVSDRIIDKNMYYKVRDQTNSEIFDNIKLMSRSIIRRNSIAVATKNEILRNHENPIYLYSRI